MERLYFLTDASSMCEDQSEILFALVESTSYSLLMENVEKSSPFVMERLVKIEEQNRSFDIEFWQRHTSTARFAAAWEMVEFAHKLKGRNATELRLQRTIESLQRIES